MTVNCSTCGRFVGQDGLFEFEHIDGPSDEIALVAGKCSACRCAATAEAVAQ